MARSRKIPRKSSREPHRRVKCKPTNSEEILWRRLLRFDEEYFWIPAPFNGPGVAYLFLRQENERFPVHGRLPLAVHAVPFKKYGTGVQLFFGKFTLVYLNLVNTVINMMFIYVRRETRWFCEFDGWLNRISRWRGNQLIFSWKSVGHRFNGARSRAGLFNVPPFIINRNRGRTSVKWIRSRRRLVSADCCLGDF